MRKSAYNLEKKQLLMSHLITIGFYLYIKLKANLRVYKMHFLSFFLDDNDHKGWAPQWMIRVLVSTKLIWEIQYDFSAQRWNTARRKHVWGIWLYNLGKILIFEIVKYTFIQIVILQGLVPHIWTSEQCFKTAPPPLWYQRFLWLVAHRSFTQLVTLNHLHLTVPARPDHTICSA